MRWFSASCGWHFPARPAVRFSGRPRRTTLSPVLRRFFLNPQTPVITVDKSLKTSELKATWTAIAKTLKADVSADTYDRWFKDIELVELDPKKLTLRVPNNIYQLWIETNYISLLRAAILLELQEPREIRFVFAGEPTAVPPMPANEPPRKSAPEDDGTPELRANGMNPRNNFEAFVVGTNNQFAQAACKAVAVMPCW